MNMRMRRNAFGTQRESFETDALSSRAGRAPYHAVFIRGPVVEPSARASRCWRG